MINYNDLHIYELRNIGRQIGVKNPTVLKKEDLIKNIEKIKKGELQPYFRKNNQGRPAKIINEKIIDLNNLTNLEKDLNISQNLETVKIFLENYKIFNLKINLVIDDFLNKINDNINNI